MKILLRLLIFNLFAIPVLHAELETFLEAEQPHIQAGAEHVNTMTDQGMSWKWTPEAGRRDYGQIFPVKQSFSARELAVQVAFCDPFRGGKRPEFSLEFLRFPSGDLKEAPEVVTTFQGLLPPNPGLGTGQPGWLRMSFPPQEFKAGESYGFLLRFAREGGAEQNVIFRVTPSSTPDGGYGIYEADGNGVLQKGPSLNFLLGHSDAEKAEAAPRAATVLLVDQRGGEGYRTLAAAVADARPGDTIRLAPGSGPYREPLFIPQSGTAEQPIIVEGNGETITGFEPLTFEKRDGEWVCDLTSFFASRSRIQGFTKVEGRWTSSVPGAFPAVLAHHGHRVFQEAATGKFEEKVRLSEDGLRLTLLDGGDREGWEISARDRVVVILDASHQIYRDLKATGSLNDGFNLHGRGEGLVFENIEGSQNLDEGFSAHDAIICEITNGVFAENDNGVGNVGQSRMAARQIRAYDNVGFGIWLLDCEATFDDLESWGNGVAQFALHGKATAVVQKAGAAPPSGSSKSRLSYEESASRADSRFQEISEKARLEGTIVEMKPPAAASLTHAP